LFGVGLSRCLHNVQGKGKGKGKGKSTKSSEVVDKPMDFEVNSGKKTEVVKLKALDVFAGCGGRDLLTDCLFGCNCSSLLFCYCLASVLGQIFKVLFYFSFYAVLRDCKKT